MGIRKSYTVDSVAAPSGIKTLDYDGNENLIAAGGTIYLDSGDTIDSNIFTISTTWQTLTADVDNGGGDITLTTKTIKGLGGNEYVVKVNVDITGNMNVATSVLYVKSYNSSDTLLETRTIALPTMSTTSADYYLNLSSLLAASYITVSGTMKEASGDYDAVITVDLEDMDEIPHGCTFTIGTEAANVINVALQLLASDGSALTGRGLVDIYLSDDQYGNTCASTAEGIAIGTDGIIVAADASLNSIKVLSESDGDIDINITETTGADTYYMVVVMPSGKKIVSDPIVFA